MHSLWKQNVGTRTSRIDRDTHQRPRELALFRYERPLKVGGLEDFPDVKTEETEDNFGEGIYEALSESSFQPLQHVSHVPASLLTSLAVVHLLIVNAASTKTS